MLRLLAAMIWLLVAYKWSDWQNWRKYYPTIQFWIIGSLVQGLVTSNYPLWIFYSPIIKSGVLNAFFVAFFIFPPMALIYISNFPEKNTWTKIKYVVFWIILSCLKELFFLLTGYIYYQNNWNYFWSVVFNFFMFPLLILHYKKPPMAWVLAFLLGAGIMILFRVPLSSLR